eukprot:9114912-Karenia_brevis.AAC.1
MVLEFANNTAVGDPMQLGSVGVDASMSGETVDQNNGFDPWNGTGPGGDDGGYLGRVKGGPNT